MPVHCSQLDQMIRGKAILNHMLVDYLLDCGAQVSVISQQQSANDDSVQLHSYFYPRVVAYDPASRTIGQVTLRRCQLAAKSSLQNVHLLVVCWNIGIDCIIGWDLINLVPEIRDRLEVERSLGNFPLKW